MKITLLILSVCWCCTLGATVVRPPIQEADIECKPVLTLKELFDAGMRPYRETFNSCGIGRSRIGIKVNPSSDFVRVEAETISFGITQDDTIKRIDLRTLASSVESTGSVLKSLASALGVELLGLDEALERATPTNPKWAEVWAQDWSNEWLRVRLGFQPLTYLGDHPTLGFREMKSHAVITVEWENRIGGRALRESPIKAPEGYEYVSMDMPTPELVKRAQLSEDPSLAHLRYATEDERQAVIEAVHTPVPKSQQKSH